MKPVKATKARALLLSLVLPGLGQVFNGQVSKAMLLFAGFSAAVPLFARIALRVSSESLWLPVVGGVFIAGAVWISAVCDAVKQAGIARDKSPSLSSPPLYAVLTIAAYALVLRPITNDVRENVVELYKVPSASMVPGIVPGDLIFVDKRLNASNAPRPPRRGDIVVFVYPNDRSRTYIKRIVGLPGDEVEVEGPDVRINGRPLKREIEQSGSSYADIEEVGDDGFTYRVRHTPNAPRRHILLTVPGGHVYLMGDNRDEAVDSTVFGPVPLRDIKGIARGTWFNPRSPSIFDRLGRSLDKTRS